MISKRPGAVTGDGLPNRKQTKVQRRVRKRDLDDGDDGIDDNNVDGGNDISDRIG